MDAGPFTTPLQYLDVALRPIDRSVVVRERLDPTGQFKFNDIIPGRYEFDLSFPGRIVSARLGGKPLALPVFELKPEDSGPLDIAVSVKTSDLSAEVRGLPGDGRQIVALLAPSDSALTLRYSSYLMTNIGPLAEFRSVPPGTYRLFIVDDAVRRDVSGYAPRFPDFLKDLAPPFVIAEEGRTKITATYIDATTVQEAIKRAPYVPGDPMI